MKGKNSKSTSKIFIIFTLFCFILIVFRTSYLALSTNIDGINIKEFANDRTIVKTSIPASRGTIYDVNGDVLAQNVSSYTLIAYLDPERSKNQKGDTRNGAAIQRNFNEPDPDADYPVFFDAPHGHQRRSGRRNAGHPARDAVPAHQYFGNARIPEGGEQNADSRRDGAHVHAGRGQAGRRR